MNEPLIPEPRRTTQQVVRLGNMFTETTVITAEGGGHSDTPTKVEVHGRLVYVLWDDGEHIAFTVGEPDKPETVGVRLARAFGIDYGGVKGKPHGIR